MDTDSPTAMEATTHLHTTSLQCRATGSRLLLDVNVGKCVYFSITLALLPRVTVSAQGGWQRPGTGSSSPLPCTMARVASAFALLSRAGKGFSTGPPEERQNQYMR